MGASATAYRDGGGGSGGRESVFSLAFKENSFPASVWPGCDAAEVTGCYVAREGRIETRVAERSRVVFLLSYRVPLFCYIVSPSFVLSCGEYDRCLQPVVLVVIFGLTCLTVLTYLVREIVSCLRVCDDGILFGTCDNSLLLLCI